MNVFNQMGTHCSAQLVFWLRGVRTVFWGRGYWVTGQCERLEENLFCEVLWSLLREALMCRHLSMIALSYCSIRQRLSAAKIAPFWNGWIFMFILLRWQTPICASGSAHAITSSLRSTIAVKYRLNPAHAAALCAWAAPSACLQRWIPYPAGCFSPWMISPCFGGAAGIIWPI